MNNDDRWRQLGRELARLRAAAGFTQHQLAPLLHYGRSTVANVEVGRQRVSRHFWERCDRVLATGGQLTATFDELQGPRPTPSWLNPADLSLDDRTRTDHFPKEDEEGDMRRRHFIGAAALLAVGATSSVPHDGGRRIGHEDVRELARRTARLRRLDNYLGGADTLQLYDAELHSTMTLFKRSSFNESTGRMLLSLVAEQAQLAGWAAFDGGDDQYATQLFNTSRAVAVQANNNALVANSLALLAYQRASQGHPDVGAAEASCAQASADVPPAVRALLWGRLAFTYSVARRAPEAGHALDRAHEVLEEPADEPAPDWAAWADHDEIQIMTGRVWAQLKRPLRAVPALEETLGRFDDTYARDKALYSTWLADAYLDAGEAERAADVLQRSIRLCEGVASPRPGARIAAVQRRLTVFRDLPAVAAVLP